jgi:undecaprenyl diphosphate synthase
MAQSITPKHVSIVMDGNGRWAKLRNLPRMAGHESGAKSVRKATEFALKHGIQVLSLFALSVENLQHRPEEEIHFLLELFSENLVNEVPDLQKNNIRLRVMGDRSVLSSALQHKIHQAEKSTSTNTALTLLIAINYSGRWDITQATQKIVQQVTHHLIKETAVDESLVHSFLSGSDLPEPDLLIRTSGEQRISNFMLWQFAYTELYFTSILWPDFDDAAFSQALEWYQTRERRFGKTSEQIEQDHV